MFPGFPYCRLFYHMSLTCSFSDCYRSIGALNEEGIKCLWAIYVGALVYLVLAIYLNQVFP